MNQKIIFALLAFVMLTTVSCASTIDTLVQWRYGTPVPTVDFTVVGTDENGVISLPTPEAVEPSPTPTATATQSPPPTFTPSPTATATPIPQIISYQDQENRFTLRYPDNWLVNEGDAEAIIFASDAQTLTSNNIEEGAVLFFFPGEANTAEEPDAAAILQLFIEHYVVFDSEEILQPVTPTTVNGQAAAVARADAVFNRYPVQVVYTALVRNNRFLVVVMMLADGNAAAFEPTAASIVQSIRLQ